MRRDGRLFVGVLRHSNLIDQALLGVRKLTSVSALSAWVSAGQPECPRAAACARAGFWAKRAGAVDVAQHLPIQAQDLHRLRLQRRRPVAIAPAELVGIDRLQQAAIRPLAGHLELPTAPGLGRHPSGGAGRG